MGGASARPSPPSPSAWLTPSLVGPSLQLWLATFLPNTTTTLDGCPHTGATVETALDDVEADPDLFPAGSGDLADINFFYRYDLLKTD